VRTIIQTTTALAVDSLPFEVVERKGSGHPDTLCDAIAETASRYYSLHCLSRFGRVAHHWCDKVMLIGGESEIHFGYGRLIRPFKVIFAGKAAHAVGDKTIPLDDLFTQAAADVLSARLRGFNPRQHLEVENLVTNYVGPGQRSSRYRPSSQEDLVMLGSGTRVSNDCNVCVGYAPLSRLERLVLETERYLNSAVFRDANIDTGSDIKLIGTRQGDNFSLLVNMPLIAVHVPSWQRYHKRVTELEHLICEHARTIIDLPCQVEINPEKGAVRAYMNVTGTAADTGDIGVVGRANRLNGLITPFRPMSIEASAGKNPLDHTGKLYGVLAMRLAARISAAYGSDTSVVIATSKERRIDDPDTVCVTVTTPDSSEVEAAGIQTAVNEAVREVPMLSSELIMTAGDLW